MARLISRSKARFRSARAAWQDIARATGIPARRGGRARHTRGQWRWDVADRNPKKRRRASRKVQTSAKRKRRRANPSVQTVGRIPGTLREIVYNRPAGSMQGKKTPAGTYYHRFGAGATIHAVRGGGLLIKPGKGKTLFEMIPD